MARENSKGRDMLFFISLKTKIDPDPYPLVLMCQGYIYVKK